MQRVIPTNSLPWVDLLRWLSFAFLIVPASILSGQFPFEDDDEPELVAGLIASYEGIADQPHTRIDEQLSFDWQTAAPDPRLDSGPFTAKWSGQLFARPSGTYRLHLFVQGNVAVEVDGTTVVEAASEQPRWFVSDDVDWSAGYHRLRVSYTRTGPAGRLGVYWSGPGFELEPIPANALLHEATEAAHEARMIERGQQLVDALRCVACHEIAGSPPLMAAPSLEKLSGNIKQSWLVSQLQDVHTVASQQQSELPMTDSHRNMPSFGFDHQTARDVAAALLGAPAADAGGVADDDAFGTRPAGDPERTNKRQAAKRQSDPQAGEQVLDTAGCLACHTYQDLGQSNLFGGGDLTAIATKRPAGFFERWLRDPAAVNPQHRMPVFQFDRAEQADLAAFLQTLDGEKTDSTAAGAPLAEADSASGREAIRRARCAACHTLAPSLAEGTNKASAHKQVRTRLTARSNWKQGCVNAPDPARQQPGYRLSATDAEAVEHYVASVEGAALSDIVTARDLLRRSQCLACHPRGSGIGNSETTLRIAERHPDAVAHVAALVPPSLNSVGDKLRDRQLWRAIAGKAKPHRPWLRVQMPRFPLRDDQIEQLVAELTAADRMPAVEADVAVVTAAPSEAVLRTVGSRLVTSSGFGCTSCHAIGDVQPAEAPISSLGPNLRELGQRVRPEWFKRWVANPLRIVPRIEMPAIVAPVAGVLESDLEHQIDAVWHVLNLPDFEPPKPNPVRVVRKQGHADVGEQAAVITDVLYRGEIEYIKPLLIGLPNRQNVLFDLAQARVAGWWSGDVAHQRTEGKRWFWESPGGNIWPAPATDASTENRDEWLLVRRKGTQVERLRPQRVGQFLTEFDHWEHTEDGGVRFSHRLHFGELAPSNSQQPDGTYDPLTIVVHQTISPRWSQSAAGSAGWSREIQVGPLPDACQLLHRPLPPEQQSPLHSGRGELTLAGDAGLRVRLASDSEADFDSEGWVEIATARKHPQGPEPSPSAVRFNYSAQIPVDQFAAPEVDGGAEQALRLDVVPGFTAEQLALPQEIMPTALSWHADGSLFVTDLKGSVWRAWDSDADEALDSARVFSDGLAAPFGIAAHDQYVDVINKYALLRLWDDGGDGTADRVETLASGWGHTADYHDWAVGLPQAKDGSYFVTLSCQQDQRSEAAAHLRGAGIRLRPREPTPTHPHRYAVERVTGGHRFPIGVAQDGQGEIYVTDNQGNYKPFNELNRVVPDAHYGFINLLERQGDFAPERTPPTIEIPHPWTHSVNGICFLDTPREIEQSQFGPFEGHLIGCEYDTRRLVRMSLQQVGDGVQGAVYPFTYDAPPTGPPLLGPISCGVSPRGELFVGNIRESGWGAGANVGNLVRFQFRPSDLPAGIAEVRATEDGFEIFLTREVDREKAVDPDSYTIASYTRVSTPQYGGDDQQRRTEKIRSVAYDAKRRVVTVKLPEMRQDFVYEIQLASLVGEGELFHPAEAFYTLRNLVPASSDLVEE